MSIFGSGQGTPQNAVPSYTSLQIQTSSSALPVPIVWGTTRIAPNIIWTGGFTATPIYTTTGSSGFLGIGDSKTTYISGYTYSVKVIFGLCEGPVVDVPRMYQNGHVKPPSAHYLTVEVGDASNFPPSYIPAEQQLPYTGLAFAGSSYFDLGTGATTGTINFEVYRNQGGLQNGVNYYDVDPAQVTIDFLTNPRYGVGFPLTSLDLGTITGASGDASYQTYCKAIGLAFSPALINTESANSILTRWLQLTNSAAVWSGGKLKILPFGDTATSLATIDAAVSATVPIPVNPSHAQQGGLFPPPTKADPKIRVDFGTTLVADHGVFYASSGAALTAVSGDTRSKGQYSLTSPGIYTFSKADQNVPVIIKYSYTPVAAFVPGVAPVYDLTDDDFVGDASADPISISRSDPFAIANVQPVEFLDRNNGYAATPVEARAQYAIETYGLRLGSSVTAHEICSAAMASRIAQLILQRGLAVRNTYAFRLSWEFGLLEPMDIVTLTDPNLGLAKAPVRITDIEEDSDGLLSVTAEDFIQGAATQVDYATGGATGGGVDPDVDPASVNPPFVFEPPSQITGGSVMLLFGLSGGDGASFDPNWGSCNVYVSYDSGASYALATTLTGPSYQGVTTASLPAFGGSNPDRTNTLSVSVAQSGVQLDPGSVSQAQALASLAVVDDEIMAYGSANLTGPYAYAVTYLMRGLYGAPAVAHAAGARFLELGGPLATLTLQPSTVGRTLLFKFQSVNVFGNAGQDLSLCTAYPKVVYGSGLFGPIAQALSRGTSLDFDLASALVTQGDDFGLASDPYTRVIDFGLASA